MTAYDLDFNALSRKFTQLYTVHIRFSNCLEKTPKLTLKMYVQWFICFKKKKKSHRGGKIEVLDAVTKEIFFGSHVYQMCLSVLRNYNVVSLQSIMQSCMQCVNDIGNLVTTFHTN